VGSQAEASRRGLIALKILNWVVSAAVQDRRIILRRLALRTRASHETFQGEGVFHWSALYDCGRANAVLSRTRKNKMETKKITLRKNQFLPPSKSVVFDFFHSWSYSSFFIQIGK
jgi:hypothetical protein